MYTLIEIKNLGDTVFKAKFHVSALEFEGINSKSSKIKKQGNLLWSVLNSFLHRVFEWQYQEQSYWTTY